MDTTEKIYTYFLACLIGVLGGIGFDRCASNTIPVNQRVQQGFVAPSRLQVKCKDEDKNGELETILQIDDKNYLLREVNGAPTLSAYEVKPAEIQYK